MKKILLFLSFLLMSIGVLGVNWNRIDNLSDISNGDSVLVVMQDGKALTSGKAFKVGGTTSNNSIDVSITSNSYISNPPNNIKWSMSVSNGVYTFKNGAIYIQTGSETNIKVGTGNSPSNWYITKLSDGYFKVQLANSSGRYISWKDDCFAKYANSNFVNQITLATKVNLAQFHGAISFYKKGASPTYTITAQSNNNIYGTVSLSENVITATPASGYMVSEATPYTVTSGTATVTQNGNTFIVTAESDCTVRINFEVMPSPIPEDNVVDIIVWDTAFIKVDIKDDDVVSVSLDDKRLDVIENIADEIFFSKYFEAASNVKLLGIYNGTNRTIDISKYWLSISHKDNDNWDKDTTFADLFTKYDVPLSKCIMEPNSELILVSSQNIDKDNQILKCAKDSAEITGYDSYIFVGSWINFNGDDAVLLADSDNYMIDLIGAGNVHGRVSTNTVTKSAAFFMDGDGWYTASGKSIEDTTQTIGLSTNRCLLIRKKSVTSGYNAVENNTSDFETFNEWFGKQIPGTGDESIESSCLGFKYVGRFDYGNYYGSFEQIYEIDLSTPGVLTDDSTYTLILDPTKYNLDTLPCTDLKITLRYSNGTEKEEVYKVPIFIKSDSIINNSNYYSLDTIICDSCDVVIMNGRSLIVNTTDTLKNRNVYVYPSAKLSVNGKYKVESLILRREDKEVPQLSYNGVLDIKNEMIFEIRTDGSDWRWVVLPDTFNISEINANVYDNYAWSDALVKHYDGAVRANNGSGGWKLTPVNTVFNPGAGFIFGAYMDSETEKRIYRINLDTAILNFESKDKGVQVYPYGKGLNKPANDLGWNVVGNPFMESCNISSSNPIRIGELVKTDTNPWDGKWVVDSMSPEKKVNYIVVKDYHDEYADAGYYKSIPLKVDGHSLEPFTSFFIQVDTALTNPTLLFTKGAGISKAPSRISEENEEIFLRVNVGNKKTGCFVSNKYDDSYEIGYDLESNENIYQGINGYKLLYSAINDSILSSGIKVYTAGGTLSLDEKTDTHRFSEIKALYNDELYDLLNGETAEVNGEFILFGTRRHNEVATGFEENYKNLTTHKVIVNGILYIIVNDKTYNVLGERVR